MVDDYILTTRTPMAVTKQGDTKIPSSEGNGMLDGWWMITYLILTTRTPMAVTKPGDTKIPSSEGNGMLDGWWMITYLPHGLQWQ